MNELEWLLLIALLSTVAWGLRREFQYHVARQESESARSEAALSFALMLDALRVDAVGCRNAQAPDATGSENLNSGAGAPPRTECASPTYHP